MDKKLKIIYLLGHSRSGSTILSLHVGSLEKIFYVGEIKKYSKNVQDRICTCNQPVRECIFWGDFMKRHKVYFDRTLKTEYAALQLLRPFKNWIFGVNQSKQSQEISFLSSLSEHVNQSYPQSEFILDSSKSLSRLILLRRNTTFDIHVLYLERDLKANLASFVKRKQGLINNFFRIKINKWIIKLYLRKHKLPYLPIQYEHFIDDPQETISEITNFIGLENTYTGKIDTNLCHAITGSRPTRLAIRKKKYQVDKDRNFEDPFSPIQKFILKLLRL